MSVESYTVTPEDTAPSTPEGQEAAPQAPQLPEKFKTVEDLVAAYTNLEAEFSRRQPQEPGKEPEQQEPAPQETPKVDLDTYVTKGLSGELTEEDYSALEAAGFSKAMVDRQVAGARAIEQELVSNVFNAVGGEETYKQMMGWAASNLSDTDKAAYDQAVNSGNPFIAKLAAQGLQALYKSSEGSDPQRQVSGAQGQSTPGTYNSWEEVTRDMNNPLYKRDPAFRQKVSDKLAASRI